MNPKICNILERNTNLYTLLYSHSDPMGANGQTNAQTNGQTNARTNGETNAQTNGQTDKYLLNIQG
jgi:hypothetical protein